MGVGNVVGLVSNMMAHKAIVKTEGLAVIAGVKVDTVEACKQKYADKVKNNLLEATRPLQKGYVTGYGQHRNDSYKGYFIGHILRPLDSLTDATVSREDKDTFLTQTISSLIRVVGEDKAWATVSKNIDNAIEHKVDDKKILGITVKQATVQKIARALKPILFPIIKSIVNQYIAYNPSCKNPEMDSLIQLGTGRTNDAAITRMGIEIDRRGEAAAQAWKAVSIKENVDSSESLQLPEKPEKGDVIQKVAVVHAKTLEDRQEAAFDPGLKDRLIHARHDRQEDKIKKLEKKLAKQRTLGDAKGAQKTENKIQTLKDSLATGKAKQGKKMLDRAIVQQEKTKQSVAEKEDARFQKLEDQIDASDLPEAEKKELKDTVNEGRTINMLPFHPDANQLGIKYESIIVDIPQSLTFETEDTSLKAEQQKEIVTLIGTDGKIFPEDRVAFTNSELKTMGLTPSGDETKGAKAAIEKVDDAIGASIVGDPPLIEDTSDHLFAELSKDTFTLEVKSEEGFVDKWWNWGASFLSTSTDPTEAQYGQEVQLLQNACRKNPQVYSKVSQLVSQDLVREATLKPSLERMVDVPGKGLCAKAVNAQGESMFLKIKTDEDGKPIFKSNIHIEDHALGKDKSNVFMNVTYSTAFETEGYYTSLDEDAHLFPLQENSDFQCSMTFNLKASSSQNFTDLTITENSRPETLDFRVVTVRELSGERSI